MKQASQSDKNQWIYLERVRTFVEVQRRVWYQTLMFGSNLLLGYGEEEGQTSWSTSGRIRWRLNFALCISRCTFESSFRVLPVEIGLSANTPDHLPGLANFIWRVHKRHPMSSAQWAWTREYELHGVGSQIGILEENEVCFSSFEVLVLGKDSLVKTLYGSRSEASYDLEVSYAGMHLGLPYKGNRSKFYC